MVKLFNVEIEPKSEDALFRAIDRAIESRRDNLLSIATLNPEILLLAKHDLNYRRILNSMEARTIDGVGLKYALWIKHFKVFKRLTGVQLVDYLLNLSLKRNLKVGVVLKEDGLSTPGEVERFLLKKGFTENNFKIRQLKIQSFEKNDFEYFEDTNILLVALGAPFQEKFIHQIGQNYGPIRVAVGVGGAIDYLTGRQKRSPELIGRIGMEWLWRLIHQPKRWRRIWNALVVFPFNVFKE